MRYLRDRTVDICRVRRLGGCITPSLVAPVNPNEAKKKDIKINVTPEEEDYVDVKDLPKDLV